MLRFRELSELFDSHLPYNKSTGSGDDMHSYIIHHPEGGKHIVLINHVDHKGKKEGHVSFMDHNGEMGVTGEHKKKSHRVLGTVRKIVTDHAKEHGLDSVHFSAAKSDRSRSKVYAKMADRSGGKTNQSDSNHQTEFAVRTKDK